MAYRNLTATLTALFDDRAGADEAVEALVSEVGVDRSTVRVKTASAQDGGVALASLRDLFIPDEDRHSYAEGMRRGGVMVSAQVEDSQVERAMDLFERHGAVDLDEREAAWRREGWNGRALADADARGAYPDNDARAGGGALTTTANGAAARTGREEQAIPVVEERLTVGKREVDRGRVRVRSYVVERPVQEQVALREEHVEVERRRVDKPVADADGDALFCERAIEATESAEEAVVGKEARVVEEVVVRKGADERVETVRDTVRRTEVKVEDDRRDEGAGASAGAANYAPCASEQPGRA